MWGSLVHNLTIETKRAVTCNFSADQWGLLTYSFPRDEIEKTADYLNDSLQEYVNEDYTLEATRMGMHNFMQQLSKYGAYDTEPREFLECVLTEIYK